MNFITKTEKIQFRKLLDFSFQYYKQHVIPWADDITIKKQVFSLLPFTADEILEIYPEGEEFMPASFSDTLPHDTRLSHVKSLFYKTIQLLRNETKVAFETDHKAADMKSVDTYILPKLPFTRGELKDIYDGRQDRTATLYFKVLPNKA